MRPILLFLISLCLTSFAPAQERTTPRPTTEIAREREFREFEATKRPEARARMIERRIELFDKLDSQERTRTWQFLETYSKTRISERIGEQNMIRELTRQGFSSVLRPCDSSNRPQGFDAVYEKSGYLIVCEAKGSVKGPTVDSLLGSGYGFRQGSLPWARASAKAVLESNTANALERRVAEQVRDAYAEKRLIVLVSVTRHANGVVVDGPRLTQTAGPRLP